MKKPLVLGVLLWIGGWYLWGEVTFSTLNLSKNHLLLFRATAERPGQDDFSTLFLGDIPAGTMEQLTFFPEAVQYLAQTGELQIQNRFGVFRTNRAFDPPVRVKKFPSFISQSKVSIGKLPPLQPSPDGRFLLYLEPTSPAYGKLMLFDLQNERYEVVSSKQELSLSTPPVRWSPDSKYFIYGKGGKLYYFSIEQYQRDALPAESIRQLGAGTVESVQWGERGDLYFIEGSLVYRILAAELFARSLYSPILRIGRIIGKIPFSFDPNFDRFWISPQGDKILLCIGGQNIFVYPLRLDDFQSSSSHLPYLLLSRNAYIKTIAWSKDDIVTLLTQGIAEGKAISKIYRIDLKTESTSFTGTEDPEALGMSLSPDQARIALYTRKGIQIRNYTTWKEERVFPFESPIHVYWIQPQALIVAGNWETALIQLPEGTKKVICLSQPEEFGFQDGKVAVRARDTKALYDPSTKQWSLLTTFQPEPPSIQSTDFRVFLEPLPSGPFKNLVMIRSLKKPGTYPLFQPVSEPYDPLPTKDEPVDFFNFTHGSRIRGRTISFVFNAVDSVEGLTEILRTLSDYNIKATFFVNGEFIRRNPGAVKEIAYSGHEVGSLFNTYFNMTDPQYKVTPEFIKQGLARNEDEYFQATGKELTLLWHTPYYILRDDFLQAAREMNYTFVGRDVDSLDWVVKLTETGLHPLYLPASDLIERILELKKPGSIISFQVGKPENGQKGNWREDYLFQRLDLLINRLLEKGYRIVPVSVLMDLSR
ncbi:MAG: polysaccharide deacetylase family protein [Spirochaetes bacterium]|nr:polysaccharide deacetylase family protein [Spirochaetota bacterium]